MGHANLGNGDRTGSTHGISSRRDTPDPQISEIKMDDASDRPVAGWGSRFRRRRRVWLAIILVIAAFALFVNVRTAANLYDSPPEGDAKIYSRIAVNLLNHG